MSNDVTLADRSKHELQEMYDSEAIGMKEHLDELDGVDVCSLEKFGAATRYFYAKKIAAMLRMSGVSKGAHLIELGCKDGLVTFPLVGMGYKVTAIDLSPECVEVARAVAKQKKIDNVEFEVGDVENLGSFPANHYDAALSFSTLRYLPDPRKAFDEIKARLKPGGSFVVDFPNRYCPWFRLLKPAVRLAPHIHDHLFSPAEVRRIYEDTGYDDIDIKLLLYMYKGLPAALVPPAIAVGEVLERIPGINRTAAIIMGRGVKR